MKIIHDNKDDYDADPAILKNFTRPKAPTPRPKKIYSLDREPTEWTKLWWPTARQQIENANPDDRSSIMKEMQLAVGQAIAAFADINLQTKYTNEADLYFSALAANLEISGYDPNRVLKGVKCDIFTDADTIPLFIMDAWEQAKIEIIEEEEEPEIPQLPEEAGVVGGYISDTEHITYTPIDVFSPRIQRVITEVSEAKSIPTSMVLAMLLALGSACIGRARGVMYRRDWREHANLYMLMIAESGSGKSHAFDYIFKYVREFEAKQKAIFKIARRQYEEDLIMFRKSKDANKIPPKKPVNIQFLLDDSTMEAVSERLEDNPRGLFWTKDEFAGFFNSLDKYNKGVSDGKNRLLQAWNVGPWSASRKTKDGDMQERFIPYGCIGMFGNVQPDLISTVFSSDDVNQGLPQRFLYLKAKIEKPMELPTPEISDEADETLRCITEKLLSLQMNVDQQGLTRTSYLTLAPEAKLTFEHYSNMIQKKSFGYKSLSYSTKLAQMTLRVALIIHFLEWGQEPMKENETESYCNPQIGYFTMYNAVKLIDWFGTHTQFARAHFPNAMKRKELKQHEIDKKKSIIIKFALKNEEFCKTLRGPQELIDHGLQWETTDNSLGRYLKENYFKKTPDKAKYAKYQLLPFPSGFMG